MPRRRVLIQCPTNIRMQIKAQDAAHVYRSARPERRDASPPGTACGQPPRHGGWRTPWCCGLPRVGATISGAASVRVFAIRGVAGLFSRGMNAVCDERGDLVSVTCTIEDFTEVTSIECQVEPLMPPASRWRSLDTR